MGSAKSDILARLERSADGKPELPKLTGPWIQYSDPVIEFRKIAMKISASVHSADSRAVCTELLGQLNCMQAAEVVCCCADGIEIGSVALSAVADTHELQSLDVCIAEGKIGVAENGAIWVDDHNVNHRAALFLTQHLVLIIESGKILNNLTEAYSSGIMDFSRFGCWISGPSKTADIEQALVIGAHGARTLDIIIIEQ